MHTNEMCRTLQRNYEWLKKDRKEHIVFTVFITICASLILTFIAAACDFNLTRFLLTCIIIAGSLCTIGSFSYGCVRAYELVKLALLAKEMIQQETQRHQ